LTQRARILSASEDALWEAAELLSAGQLVAIPTETVYGLAANATDPAAVTRVFAVKMRPVFDPLIVHVPRSMASLDELIGQGIVSGRDVPKAFSETFSRMTRQFWPGPLTVLAPRGPRIPDLVTSGMENVAIRMPAHPVAAGLLEKLDFPLAAPSANRFGRISPTTAQDVMTELGDQIPLILDGGPCQVGIESTVVALHADGSGSILRPGGIPWELLHAVVPGIDSRTQQIGPNSPAIAPGQLASHYAPAKKMILLERGQKISNQILGEHRDIAVMEFEPSSQRQELPLEASETSVKLVQWARLGERGNSSEAAQQLFGTLRSLDEGAATLIIAILPASRNGLWHAVVDRLRRAAAPRG
jgi:L-threonylcarbamoyladenylate synthase